MMSGSRNPNLGLIASGPDEYGAVNARESNQDRSQFWRKNLGRTTMPLGLPRPAQWWTGLEPSRCPGYDAATGRLHSLAMPNLASCSRQSVLDYFDNTWTLNELLFSSLIGEEPFYRPPYHALRHPLMFYYVHPSVLYVSKLRLAGLLDHAINPYFENLFETGVDEMSWDDMSKNEIEWPSIDDGRAYRAQVYATVRGVILDHPGLADGHAPIGQTDPLWALFMGFEHERIHLETSSVLIRELPVHLVAPPQEWPALAPTKAEAKSLPLAGQNYPDNKLIEVEACTIDIGKAQDFPSFGWDNEYGSREASVPAFAAASYLTSNGEYWQFVSDGGYHQKENWSEEGWRWRSFRNVKWPTFWVPDGPAGAHHYRLRTCFEVVSMPWDWPAVVNYHEAEAFCRWRSEREQKSFRLITEAEHHALRIVADLDLSSNANLRWGSESAVDAATDSSGTGFGDVFGNLWQWTEDHFYPLDGFAVHSLYDDFSLPCFDGEHQMILGGSFISTGAEATAHARFHFRPHFFQHAGFRLVSATAGDGAVIHLNKDGSLVSKRVGPYETQPIFNEYMTLHYAPASVQMPYLDGPLKAVQFPQRCADLVAHWAKETNNKTARALDIGCAVGGASFKLAETYDRVTGVDLSGRFIDAARELQSRGSLDYKYKLESNIYEDQKAVVDPEIAQRVQFFQADACNLSTEYVDFDAVLMANLLCRLPNPQACLEHMSGDGGVVRQGGLLVIVSPYSWLADYTPEDKWLGGFVDAAGQNHFSEDGLKALLSANFDLLDVHDVPLVIREHRRKFQCIVSQAMVWRRR